MIVSVNQNVDNLTKEQKYNQLFAKAFQALKEAGKLRCEGEDKVVDENAGTFHTIDEYFAHLEELFALDSSYIMLPLDETPFAIDANKRTISNPKITVMQKDQNAEVVIFTIDRYFDYKDLNTAQIYVQWTLPDGTEGASKVEMKDLSIPGKIRFGWPLDNEITSQEGAVKFSVRFWNKEILKDENGQDKDTVVYSFNTQTSTLNITKSLQVEINEGPSVNSPISEGFFKKAIRNSSIVNENIAIPVEPRFDEPGLNLFDFESLTENDLTMKAQATCGDTGIISYEWYYKPAEAKKEGEDVIFRTDTWYPFEDFDVEVKNEEGEITTEKHPGFNAYGGTKADEYVLVGVSGDFSLVTGEKYYMENPDTTDIENTYIPFNGSVGKNLYERFTTYRVPVGEKANEKVTGQYKVVVKNTLGPNISNEVESKVCQLVSPDDITLKINGDLPLIKIITADDNQLKLNLVDDNNFGVNRTYTWSRSIDNKETFNILEDETQNNLAVLTPGWYKVHVDSTLNRETKKLESTICKATFAPIAPERLDDDEATQQILTMSYGENAQSQTFDPDTKIPQYFATENPDDYRIFDIQMNLNTPDGYDDKLYSEEFIYIWQYQRLDGDFITLTNDDVSTDDITKPVVSGLGTNALTVRVVEDNILYTYRCIVTNVLNGEKASCSEAQALAFAIK